MALTYGFYNSKNHDRTYDAEQVGQIFDGVINDGIFTSYKDGLVVKADSNLSAQNKVIIKPGRAWFDHTWTYNDANYDLTLPAPETALDRYDAVVLDINHNVSSRKNSITYIKGTPASNPTKPSMATGDEKHKRYPLCYVLRKAGKTRIDQADITNARGTSACPFVTPVTETFTIDNIILQWQGEWSNFLTASGNEWTTFITNKDTAWTSFFTSKSAQWDQFFTSSSAEWSTFITSKTNEWSSFLSSKTTEWNNYKTAKERDWNQYQVYMTAKISRYEELMETSFSKWIDTEKTNYEDFLRHNEIAWNKWFSNVQYQLDGDVAGHLQTQIDEIAKFAHIYVVDKVLYVPMSGASVSGKKLIFAT